MELKLSGGVCLLKPFQELASEDFAQNPLWEKEPSISRRYPLSVIPRQAARRDDAVTRAARVIREAVDRAPDERGEQKMVGGPPFGGRDLGAARDRHPAAAVDRHRVFEDLCLRQHGPNRTGSVRSRSYCPAP